jgi:hypothetical protein
MKKFFYAPGEIALLKRLSKERVARGVPTPHSMLDVPDGTLAVIRTENVRWANRRARREAIAASRTPRPDENCPHCDARLSDGCPALLIFKPRDTSDYVEISMLCHRCAALPDEEILAAAHTRRRAHQEEQADGRWRQ